MVVHRRGSKGEKVKRLQTRLKQLGHYRRPIDGNYGPGTEKAVRAFQRAERLKVDGKVGPTTWAALFKAEKRKARVAKRMSIPPVNVLWESAALVQLLERKGILTRQEVLAMVQELVRPVGERKHPRFRFRGEIWFPGKEMSEAGTVSNLAVGGCKVDSAASLYIGMYLALDVFLRDQETPLKVDQAVVRWAKEQEFGLEFISMWPEEEERLRDVVGTLETRPSH